jgi:hypothetical protein
MTGTLNAGHGGTGLSSLTTYGLITAGTTATGNFQQVSNGSSGQVLQSGGASALPSFSTATYPSTATSTGTLLRANGTNWVVTTSTFADTYSASSLLYSNGANTVTGLATANNGVLITSNSGVPSLLANSGTPGYVLTANSGAPPSWQAITAEGAITTIDGDSGSITASAGVVTISGGSTGLTTSGASHTLSLTGTLALANGGTNANLTANNGGIFYSTATAGAILSGTATAQQLLMSGASTTPQWSTSTYPLTNAANTLLYASSANTMAALATANSAALVTSSSGVPAWSATMTNGQLIIGSTTATPTAATLTAGTGISITNGAGSITIASSGVGALFWNDVSGTTQAAAVNSGYIISNASQTTVTLPATAAEGSTFAVQGKGAGGWILQMNTGQTCHFGNAATASAGSLTSTNQWDSVSIVCVTANTTFAVYSSIGNLTVA